MILCDRRVCYPSHTRVTVPSEDSAREIAALGSGDSVQRLAYPETKHRGFR